MRSLRKRTEAHAPLHAHAPTTATVESVGSVEPRPLAHARWNWSSVRRVLVVRRRSIPRRLRRLLLRFAAQPRRAALVRALGEGENALGRTATRATGLDGRARHRPTGDATRRHTRRV